MKPMSEQEGDAVCDMVLALVKHLRDYRLGFVSVAPVVVLEPEGTGIRVDADVWDAVYKRSA